MVTPRFSASGSSVSVASSATRDRSTCALAKDRWSARLSSSSASVRSIARVLTALEAVDELAVVAGRVGAGHVEQGLRDRERRAQLVGGVGREPLLLGDLRLEPREHGVEGVGELAELVVGALAAGSGARAIRRRQAGGVGDAGQRREHPAGEDPPSDEAEHQQERHRPPARGAKARSEVVERLGMKPSGPPDISTRSGT